jgi:hypothetical protein
MTFPIEDILILPDVKMILLPQTQLEPVPVCVTGQFRSWLTVVIALDMLGRKSLGGVGVSCPCA